MFIAANEKKIRTPSGVPCFLSPGKPFVGTCNMAAPPNGVHVLLLLGVYKHFTPDGVLITC